MSTAEKLREWRAEIAVEIAEAETALAAARETVITAGAEAQSAKAAEIEIWDSLSSHAIAPNLSNALRLRASDLRHPRRAAEGKLARATGDIKNRNFQLADLRAALEQLDLLLTPAPINGAAPVPEVAPVLAPVSDFDPIRFMRAAGAFAP